MEKNLPSMSNFLPMVFRHCFPARAILRNLRSPSKFTLSSGEEDAAVELAAVRVDCVAPEKKA